MTLIGEDMAGKLNSLSLAIILACFFTGSIARSAKRRLFKFEVYRPAGATRCTDGAKFGTQEGTARPLRAKLHPHRCNGKGIGPQN